MKIFNFQIFKFLNFQIFLTIVCVITLSGRFVSAQTCQANHTGYSSVPDSGIILPDSFPHAIVGVPIVQVVTIGIPSKINYQGKTYKINWIKFDSLQNPQPGMTMLDSTGDTNYPKMKKDTWNCMTFEWTPDSAGNYIVGVVADVNITVIFPFTVKNQTLGQFTLVVDNPPTSIPKYELVRGLNSCKPNPFDDKTIITYYSEKKEISELKIYSMTGQLVYAESLNTYKGKNDYSLYGNKLNKGVYISCITSCSKTSYQKLIRY